MRAIRGGEIALIFQEPMTSFSPVHTIGDQIVEAIRLHQTLSKKAAYERAIELLQHGGSAARLKDASMNTPTSSAAACGSGR